MRTRSQKKHSMQNSTNNPAGNPADNPTENPNGSMGGSEDKFIKETENTPIENSTDAPGRKRKNRFKARGMRASDGTPTGMPPVGGPPGGGAFGSYPDGVPMGGFPGGGFMGGPPDGGSPGNGFMGGLPGGGSPNGKPPGGGFMGDFPGGGSPNGNPPGSGFMGGPPGGGSPNGNPPGGGFMGGPPGGGPPGGDSPGGVPYNSTPPSESAARSVMWMVMPNFGKWRGTIMNINILAAIITFVTEIIMYFILQEQGLLFQSSSDYMLRFLAIPTILNCFTIAIALLLRRYHPEHIMLQNSIPVFAFTIICTVISTTHYAFSDTLALFCLPIFMTAIFSNIKFCWLITGCCTGGLTCALCVRYFLAQSDPYFLQEGIIAYLMVFVAGFLSYMVLSMTSEQKNKLINFAIESKQAQKRETVANNAKSAFLANMSHEIRTPINAVLGMNEMILRETKEKQIREYASNIHIAGNSLLSIINDVLDITKIETGKLDIVEVDYETASLIHDSYNMVANRLADKGLSAVVDCEESLPYKLNGDEVRIRQSIVNLLTNAVKYTEKGTITLSVRGERLSDQEIRLLISVKDTGIGISEENQKKLFLQFQRVDLERNRNIEGSGLGLALTKQLIDLMHGDITVESKYGEGSTFTITLPQKIVDNKPMGKFQKDYTDIYQKNTARRQQLEAPDAHILVVDDVPMNLKVIQNLLKNTKINVDTANSGAACLGIVQEKKYDLIFMDHMMPEMDGMETMARMRELANSENSDTPVIMLTANVVAGIKDDYMKAGFADYLPKPVRGDKLENMIRQYLPPHLLK